MSSDSINLTPVGLQSPEGVERVNAAMKAFTGAQADAANKAVTFANIFAPLVATLQPGWPLTREDASELFSSFDALRTSLDAMIAKEDDYWRAVDGDSK